ncbi:hypothetical protein [Nocardia gipuzkoensis]|uniref:hypothetical protein n=1 Tax=Nocardia gipuzkoensis TaxID=2749991 RepID=UPI003EDF4D21
MGRLIVVEGDTVRGNDTHNVTGTDTSVPPNPYTGTGAFAYDGAITDRLGDFVLIEGKRVALVTSSSTLNRGEDQPPTGRHCGPKGANFTPAAPAPNPMTLTITDAPLGAGRPSAGSGSSVLTVDGTPVLLDGDSIDTCSGVGATAGSSVTAEGQSVVTAT